MILARTVVFLLLGAAASAQDFECPDSSNPPCQDRLYPNPYNCNQYYQCAQSCDSYLFNCAHPDLHFNPDLQACVLPSNYSCSETPFPEPSVFFVGRDTNQPLRQDPVSFQIEVIDRTDDFDMASSHFTAPSGGIYFFTMNMGVIDGRSTSFVLSSSLDYIEEVDIRRSSNEHNGADTTSRDLIKGLSPADTFSMLSLGSLYSDSGLQTSFGGFSLHDAMTRQDAFSVSRTNGYTAEGTIVFNNEITNEGRHFNLNNGVFTVPADGTYFFSYSVGMESSSSNANVAVQLRVGPTNQSEIWRNHADYDGFDTLSRTQMLNLNAGQEVTLHLVRGEIDSNANHQICWNCFLYDPSSPDPDNALSPTAWSVHRTTTFSASSTSLLTFDDVDVNVGGAFNAASSEVNIAQSGYYFLHINAGAMANTRVNMRILVNGGVEATLLRDSSVHSGVDTLGRSIVLYLSIGDQIQIQIAGNTGVYSNANRQTSFTGFLIVNR